MLEFVKHHENIQETHRFLDRFKWGGKCGRFFEVHGRRKGKKKQFLARQCTWELNFDSASP